MNHSHSTLRCRGLRAALITLAVTTVVGAFGAAPHLPPGIKPLPSAAPKGRGPLALVNLNHQVFGYARVFGGKMPDLFLAGYGGPEAVHLFRWVDAAETGAPVFAHPVKVKSAFRHPARCCVSAIPRAMPHHE